MTVIYPSPIFGPVESRRLGISLGINLMPGDGKVCTFDCIYCECGYNVWRRPQMRRPTRQEVADALEACLRQRREQGLGLDDISFAGNGEPTCHPDFPAIIEDALRIRDEYYAQASLSVLSNATMLGHASVRQALLRVDNNIQKLDTVSPTYINKVDRPVQKDYNVDQVIENMKAFHGHVIIQTMFMKGLSDSGENVDNTGEAYVMPWLEALREIRPQKVMVYTIDRETPAHGLGKASPRELNSIQARVEALGIECSVAY